eukprot:GFUD01045453.1.p1 GENE.GFUD01045453.1~~GFUD01045453.1.p1  ORF type:complete len:1159 (+),score=333.30 GFUD01045453.1:24-3479(+)
MAMLDTEDLRKVVEKDAEVKQQAIQCRMEGVKNMVEWENKVARNEYKVMLVCCGVEDKNVALVREVGKMLVEGEKTSVVVTHVSHEGVWVTPVKQMELLDKTMDQLEAMRGRLKRVEAAKIHEGRLAVAKFSEDGQLYRCVVDSVQEKGTMVVRYVDYGNTELLDFGELLELPDDLLTVPPLAVYVKVEGVENVKLEGLLDQEGISVLVVQGVGTLSLGNEVFGNAHKGTVPPLSITISALPPPLILPLNRHIEGVVVHVSSSGAVWFTPSSLAPLLDKLKDQLALLSPSPVPRVEVDQVCTTRFSLDGELYRAMVKEVSEDQVKVLFLDYGNTETKIKEEVLEISEDSLNLPAAAILILPARSFNKEQKEEVEKLLSGTKLTVKQAIEGGKEVGRFFIGMKEIIFGEERPKDDTAAVTLSYIERVGIVWVNLLSSLDGLDVLMGQLADMVDRLVPDTSVVVGSTVVARYTEDNELYRATVVEMVDTKVTLLFVDFGNYQECLTSSLYALPIEMSLERVPAAAIKVKIPGGEEWHDNEKNRVVLENLLEKENLTLSMNDEIGIFSVHGDEIEFSKFLQSKDAQFQRINRDLVPQKHIPIKQTLDQEPECLREEANLSTVTAPVSGLGKCLADAEGDKERVADQSTVDQCLSDQALYEEEAAPGLSPDKFKATAARSRYSDRWTVGDRVVAYWSVDNRWRVGVIHELYRSEAYVICPEEPGVRPALVEMSHLKPMGMPVDALNKVQDALVGLGTGRRPEDSQEGFQRNDSIMNATDTTQNNTATSAITRTTSSTTSVMTMTPSLLLLATDEDLCTFARSGAGSRYLQTLVSPENKKLCEKMVSSILASNPLRMMTNPVGCYLVQKILGYFYILPKSQQFELLAPIISNFSRLSLNAYGYHVVLTAITHLGPEQRECFILELENYVTLLSLLKSKFGTFVAQACVPHLPPRTVTALVNSLLGHVVELACLPQGSFFLQQFVSQWGHSSTLDFLAEDILRHLRPLVHHSSGTYVVQALVKSRTDYHHLALVTQWMVNNMEAVYKDKPAVHAIRCVIYLLAEKIKEDVESQCQWSKLLDQIVVKMTVSVQQSRPLIIHAACHPEGHLLVRDLTKLEKKMGRDVRKRMVEMMMTYRTVLVADMYGCIVLRDLQGLL